MPKFSTNQSHAFPFSHSIYDEATGVVVATLPMRRAPRGKTRDDINHMAENDGIGLLARRIVASLELAGDDKTHTLEQLVERGATVREVIETLTASRQQLHSILASLFFMRRMLKGEAEGAPESLETRTTDAIDAIDHIAPEKYPPVMQMVEQARATVAAKDQAQEEAPATLPVAQEPAANETTAGDNVH